jgi:hypothetical protein
MKRSRVGLNRSCRKSSVGLLSDVYTLGILVHGLNDAQRNIELAKRSATFTLARASKEDSAVIKDIAIEAKKDSSATKTIAIMTICFLPSTFLAVSPPASNHSISKVTEHVSGCICHVRVQLGRRWCSCHESRVQVLLGRGCTSHIRGAGLVDARDAIAVAWSRGGPSKT